MDQHPPKGLDVAQRRTAQNNEVTKRPCERLCKVLVQLWCHGICSVSLLSFLRIVNAHRHTHTYMCPVYITLSNTNWLLLYYCPFFVLFSLIECTHQGICCLKIFSLSYFYEIYVSTSVGTPMFKKKKVCTI